jgi:hypothetical protein
VVVVLVALLCAVIAGASPSAVAAASHGQAAVAPAAGAVPDVAGKRWLGR